MGSVGKDKRGWWYRYSETIGGVRRQPKVGGFRRKSDAEDALAEVLYQKKRAPLPSSRKLGPHLQSWLEQRVDLSPQTVETYRRITKNHILSSPLADIPLAKLTASDLSTWLAGLRDENHLAAGTRVTSWRLLRAALKVFVVRKEVSADVLLGVETPRKAHPQIAVLSPEQLHTVLEHLRGRWLYAPVHVAATTGLRIGELLALRWEDLQAGALVVQRSLFYIDGKHRQLGFKPPKTEERRRVELYPETLAVLDEWKTTLRRRQFLLGSAFQTEGLIFPRPSGGPWRPNNLSAEWRRQLKKLYHFGVPLVRFHDLRHSHASHLLAAGVPIVTVSHRLGHASPETTMRIYSHLIPGQQREAVTLGSAFLRVPQGAKS